MENHRLECVLFILFSSTFYNSSGNKHQDQLLNLEEDVLNLQAEFVSIRKDLRLERISRHNMIDTLNHTIYQCTGDCKGTGLQEIAAQDFKERSTQTSQISGCNALHIFHILQRSFHAEKVKRRELENNLADTENKYSELVKAVNTFEEKLKRLQKHDYDIILSKISDVETKLEKKVDVIDKKFAELASKVENLTTFDDKQSARINPVRAKTDPVAGRSDSSCHVRDHCTNAQFPADPCTVIVPRVVWGARATRSVSIMREPVSIVFIHHTVTERCYSTTICTREVKKIQNVHMDVNGWDDIGYSFVVGEDGRAYEARGWDRVGAHTRGWNDVSISIAVLGNFNQDPPSESALQAINSLIDCGLREGKVKQDYKLYGHRDAAPTFDSPGNVLYNMMKTWPHYKNILPVREKN